MSVLNADGSVLVEGKGSGVVPAHLTRMCWIEPSKTLSETYAALAELITQVHALPFELNCKHSTNLYMKCGITYCVVDSTMSLFIPPYFTRVLNLLYTLYSVKGKDGSRLSLLEPSKGCTMLLHYPQGSSQMSRIDSRDDGSDLDSGIRYD